MKKMKLAVLGCGNMGSAIIRGVAKKSQEFEYFFYTPTVTRARELANAVGGKVVEKLEELPPCDLYLIACKPQQFSNLAQQLNPVLNPESVFISVMAGVTTTTMRSLLPRGKSFVRTMPNTPCLIGEGVTGIFFTSNINASQRKIVQDLFAAVSKVFSVHREEDVDVIGVVTSCGPAYLFEIAHCLIQKVIAMGIPRETADAMIRQLFIGSSLLMAKSETSPEELRHRVTSKGGSTEKALAVFSKRKLSDIFSEAIDAAYARVKELSQ